MSAADVEEIILRPMQAIFDAKFGVSDEQTQIALREYADSLSGFDREDLQAAWGEIKQSHQKRSWPPVASFVLAARKSRKERTEAASELPRGYKRPDKAWADWLEARTTKKAYEAAKNGVSWSLKCQILSGTPLGDINISSLVHEHNRASALADAMENGVIFEARSPIANRLKEYTFEPDMANEALGLWRQILIREAETQAEILGQREGDRF